MLPQWFPFLVLPITLALTGRTAITAWKGQYRPVMATWVLWVTLPMIAAAAAWVEGAGTAAVSIAATGAGPLLVFLAGLLSKNGVWEISAINIVCVSAAIAATVGWWLTSEPLVAAVLATAGDAAAFIPTLVRIIAAPGQESPWAYVSGLLSSLSALFVVQDISVTTILFPAYIASACITALVLDRRTPKTASTTHQLEPALAAE